jgi:hypothetical protein
MRRTPLVAAGIAGVVAVFNALPAHAAAPDSNMSIASGFNTASGCTLDNTGGSKSASAFTSKTLKHTWTATATNNSDPTDTVAESGSVRAAYKSTTKAGSLATAALHATMSASSIPASATTACTSGSDANLELEHGFTLKKAGRMSIDLEVSVADKTNTAGAYIYLVSESGIVSISQTYTTDHSWGSLKLPKGDYALEVEGGTSATSDSLPSNSVDLSVALSFTPGK